MLQVHQHLKNILGVLEKEADVIGNSARPQGLATSDLSPENCVETLVKTGCLDEGDKEVMKEALRDATPASLACMTVLAKHADQQALVSSPVGIPVGEDKAPRSVNPKKLAEERYREASRRLN